MKPSPTRVVNVRRERADHYIGRPSRWGNPFVIGPDGDRDLVIAKYHRHILDRMLERPVTARYLLRLRGQRLGCYCKPAACHGDVLVEIIEALEGLGDNPTDDAISRVLSSL